LSNKTNNVVLDYKTKNMFVGKLYKVYKVWNKHLWIHTNINKWINTKMEAENKSPIENSPLQWGGA
jgi:hypothetical protein